MQEPIKKYLATRIIEDLRRNRSFKDDFYEAVFEANINNYVRPLIRKSDKALVLKLCRSKNDKKAWFGRVLSRRLLKDKDVRRQLLRMWNSSKTFSAKIGVVYDLTEYPDLYEDKELIRSFLKFITKNWGHYRTHVINWYGGEERIIDGVDGKLRNRKLKHKRWLYILNLSISSEKTKAHKRIKTFLDDPDEFVQEVAKVALRKAK